MRLSRGGVDAAVEVLLERRGGVGHRRTLTRAAAGAPRGRANVQVGVVEARLGGIEREVDALLVSSSERHVDARLGRPLDPRDGRDVAQQDALAPQVHLASEQRHPAHLVRVGVGVRVRVRVRVRVKVSPPWRRPPPGAMARRAGAASRTRATAPRARRCAPTCPPG
eukprot:scaffold24389_cov41-Phaeocystis_antarctica.AAC.2